MVGYRVELMIIYYIILHWHVKNTSTVNTFVISAESGVPEYKCLVNTYLQYGRKCDNKLKSNCRESHHMTSKHWQHVQISATAFEPGPFAVQNDSKLW